MKELIMNNERNTGMMQWIFGGNNRNEMLLNERKTLRRVRESSVPGNFALNLRAVEILSGRM